MSRSRFAKLIVLLLLLGGWGLWSGNAAAATRYAVSSGAWNLTSTWSASSGGGSGASVPVAGDVVNIGETGTTRTPTIPAAYTAACATLNIGGNGSNSTLTLSANTSALNVSGNITINRPTSNTRTVGLNVNAGTVNVTGSVVFAGTNTTTSRDNQITITSGSLTIGGGLVFTAGAAGNNTITMSGGAGTINLAGDFTSVAGGYTAPVGTLTPGATSTVNFNGSAVAQTIPIGVSSIIYHNIYVNNTNASGATLSAAITGTNATGDLRVQSGILNNGGFAIASAGGGDVLEVANGARLNLTGTSSFPTGFSTNTLGATSTVNYGGTAQTVTNMAYGNLMLSGSNTKTMQNSVTVTNDFTISSGVTVTAGTSLTVGGDWSETGTFNPGTRTVTLNGASAQTISGTVVFNNLTVTNTANPNITLATYVTVGGTLTQTATINLTPNCAPDYTLTAGALVLHSCPATAPTVTTNAATALAITGATLNGTVSSNRADTDVTFEYGLTTGYGSSITATQSPVLGSNSSPTAVSAAVTGLTCSKLYHFRAIGVNSVGTTNGGDQSFTTLACAAPTVVTNAASALSISGATLNGTVSSNGASTTVTFDYGLATNTYTFSATAAQSPLGTGASGTAVSAAVSGLTCNTIYYFRVKGVNSVNTTNGSELIFTTSACPSLGTVINTYYPGSTATVAAGTASITLGAATGVATAIAIGDTLIIMQMQDASINSTNTDAYGDGTGGDKVGTGATTTIPPGGSGLYEYVIATSNVATGGGTLTLACGTTNAYANAAYAAGSAGQKKYQVIRVPVYSNATLTSGLTARAWDGSTGGVLALDVTGALTLNSATVTVDGMGFRGGASRTLAGGAGVNTDFRTLATVAYNASKGEGIAGTPYYVFTAPSTLTNTGVEGYPNGSHARGAPANAGGGATDINPAANDQNSAGGGGANYGAGGMGGIGWCPTFANSPPNYVCGLAALTNATNPGGSTGGFGGSAVAGLGATRLTLGGGGGGGSTNNGTGALAGGLSSSGAAGGGVIMLRAASMSGSATFNANGSSGDHLVCNDGAGGGGAGGAVLISAGSGIGGVTINVKGGPGGNTLTPPCGMTPPHGPGGGGGGGYAITTGAPAACSAAAGAYGVTYNNSATVFPPYLGASYGSTAGSAGACVPSLAATAITGTPLGATSCVNHYELSVLSSSITCLSTTVTVTACADAAPSCTLATGVTGGANLLTTGGTFDTSGLATVTAIMTASVASTTFSYPLAADGTAVTVSLTGGTIPTAQNATTCNGGVGSCTTTFHTAGFIFTANAGDLTPVTIPTKVAGTPSGTYYLRAVKTSDNSAHTCGAALKNTTIPINFAYQCNNPTTCYATDLMTVNGGSGSTTIKGNPNTASLLTASWLPVNMTFDGTGNALFTFNYSDVGKVTLWANTTVNSAVLTGSSLPSGGFVVKPGGFKLSNIVRSSDGFANPAAAAADTIDSKFVQAGEAFSVTVTAVTSTESTAYNYGREIAAEGVKLTNALVPGLGLTSPPPPVANNTVFDPFNNGMATGTTFNWPEVGIITLTPSVGDASYLGVGDVTGTPSGNVGRFYAAKLVLSAGSSIANRTDLAACGAGCGTFTYMGEQMTAKFTLTAKAVDGTTTLKNYNWSATPANYFAKLDPMGPVMAGTGGPLVLGAVNNAAPRTPFLPCGSTPCVTPMLASAGSFVAGVATNITVPFTVFRGNTPAGPYAALSVGIAPQDSDGAILSAYDLDTVNVVAGANNHGKVGDDTEVRFGRIKLSNAFGSENSILNIPLQAQYWSGSSWVLNTADSATPVPASGVARSNYRPTSAWTTTVTGPGTLVGGLGGSLSIKTDSSGASVAASGAGISLSPPMPLVSGKHPTGSVDICVDLGDDPVGGVVCPAASANLPYLKGIWPPGTTYDNDPSATATFGVYSPEIKKTVHVRELY